jgi:hypothetical protein
MIAYHEARDITMAAIVRSPSRLAMAMCVDKQVDLEIHPSSDSQNDEIKRRGRARGKIQTHPSRSFYKAILQRNGINEGR